MAARKTNTAKHQLTDEQWGLIHRFALSLERARFNDYIETLQRPHKLVWSGFLSGLAKGFGAVVGATIVVAIVVTILGALGDNLPGELGDFFSNTSRQIQHPTGGTP